MNIVIAIDSFKGSLSSIEAGNITAAAIHDILPEAHTQVFPLADGGEGTVDALTAGFGGRIVKTEVTGPLGDKIMSRYGFIEASHTAIIEMADAAGITMVPREKLNPLHTTTYGLGELILHAAENGCRSFIIGIGGSATNDCGIGMLTALGIRFKKADGSAAGIYGRSLADIASIDSSGLKPVIRNCSFRIACDVTNPLYGEKGCSAIFGPQKGATPEIVKAMDASIHALADKIKEQLGIGAADAPGTGAAGGLGYAFRTFLPATLEPGIALVLDAIRLKEALQTADIAITGEGRMDLQTAMGKAPIGVASLAKKSNPAVRTLAFCGCATEDAEAVNKSGIDAYFPILHEVVSLDEALRTENAARNLRQTVHQVFRLLK
jgi:glycerate kinase